MGLPLEKNFEEAKALLAESDSVYGILANGILDVSVIEYCPVL